MVFIAVWIFGITLISFTPAYFNLAAISYAREPDVIIRFLLSFNNLMTKKGRTILVSLAGSIGIIGIALILSLSTGFQNYIDKIQEDTLSSYPLTIYEENADMTQILLSMMGSNEDENIESNKVYERDFVTSMFGNVSKNWRDHR